MKKISYFFFNVFCAAVLLVPFQLKAQEIRFWYLPETEHFAPDEFRTDLWRDDSGGRIRVRDHELVFGDGQAMVSGYQQASISEDRSFAGVLFIRGDRVSAEIYRTDGTLLHQIDHLADYDGEDPSIRLYMLNNGSFLYRDNIASFTYFDARGEEVFQLFNSTGSPDGEAISEFTATPFGHAMAAYNPRIFTGDRVESRLQLVQRDGESSTLLRPDAHSMVSVKMHRAGRLMLVHVLDESKNRHRAQLVSVRGDLIADIDYEDNDIEDLVMSDCARYITAWTSGRVMVHDAVSGERLGSASFRERVQAASYMPDGNLAVLTGNRSNRQLRDLRMHIIDISDRRVVREETALTAYTSGYFPLTLIYEGSSTYRLQGVNRELIIRHTL